jgi:hypothetical protein
MAREQGPLLVKMIKSYTGDYRLACTTVGIERLAYPGCLVEISLNAALPG